MQRHFLVACVVLIFTRLHVDNLADKQTVTQDEHWKYGCLAFTKVRKLSQMLEELFTNGNYFSDKAALHPELFVDVSLFHFIRFVQKASEKQGHYKQTKRMKEIG